MRRIQTDRRQHRHHFALEITADPFVLLRREFAAAQETDAFPFHAGQDFLVQQLILPCHQFMRFARHLAVNLLGAHLVGTDRRGARLDFGMQTGDADFEEFIQIAADNAQEAQTFEQRVFAVFRLRQNPAVE